MSGHNFLHQAMVRLFSVLLGACVILAFTAGGAQAAEPPQLTEAQAYEICDQDGTILASSNASEHLPPASTTKIMTAMVALDAGMDMDAVYQLYDVELPANSQNAGVGSEDTLTFRQLMDVMLIYSANDAAENVAIIIAGSEEAFVALMNEKAAEIGMTDTHFANPHGLEDDGHYSSAHDLVTMGRYALENYPYIANTVTKRSVTLTLGSEEKTFESTDELLETYAGMCGIKTGAVESGKSFLGSAKRHGRQLFTAVLGCETVEGRFTDTRILMDWYWDTCLVRLELARSSWPIRVVSAATTFWGKRVVYPAWDAHGHVLPGQDVAYATKMSDSDLLLDAGAPFGSTAWTQDGRPVAYEVYQAESSLVQISSWNIFSLPLFYDLDALEAA